MNASGLKRVQYTDGQELSVADFVAEQQYHIAMDRRHNADLHTWGIVRGLKLEVHRRDDGEPRWSFKVWPGFAIDGYGRELLLEDVIEQDLHVDLLTRQAFVAVDVCLQYNIEKDYAPDHSAAIVRGHPADPIQRAESESDRWDETPVVRLYELKKIGDAASDSQTAMRADPTEAQILNWNDNEPKKWPVCLGRIALPVSDDKAPFVEKSVRRYVGLVGHEVRSHRGDARLVLGGTAENEQSYFSVHVKPPGEAADSEGGEEAKADEPATQAAETCAMWIDGEGAVHVDAGMTVKGDVRMDGGGVAFGSAAASEPYSEGWQIYRSRDPQTKQEDLRIELPDGDETGEVAVGAWTSEGAFKTLLAVSASGTVFVAGDLHVNGLINPPGSQKKRSLADETQAAAKLSAVNAAASLAAAEPSRQALLQEIEKKSLAAWLSGLIKKILGIFGLGPDGSG